MGLFVWSIYRFIKCKTEKLGENVKQSEGQATKVFSNTLIYMISGLLLKGFSFFLLPLYTRFLTTEDYGITSLTGSFLITASYLASLSLFSAVFRFYVDLKQDSQKLSRFYGTIINFVLLSTIFLGIFVTIFQEWFIKYIFLDMDFYPTVILAIVSLVFFCQYIIYENVLKSQQKASKYAKMTISYFILTLILNLYFIVYLRLGANGVLIANFISYFVFTLVFWIDLWRMKMIEFCFDITILKEALAYSIPIIPHNLSTQLALLISKILMGESSDLAAVGLYAVASQLGNIADVIQNYVNSAYGPWLYEQLSDFKVEMKTKIASVSSSLVFLLGFFLLGIALFSHDFIILFLQKDYALSWTYVPLIVWVMLIKTIYYFYVEVLFYYKNASKFIFIATLSSSFLNIVLSYYLIIQFGIVGSILADFISMIVRIAIVIYLSKRFKDIGLRLKDFIINILIVSLFMLVGLYFTYSNYQTEFNVYDFLYRVVVLTSYVLLFCYKYRNSVVELINRVRGIRNES